MKNELLYIGAAYIRVSDERQDEYSPDSQLKKIREYAAKDGYLIPDEYVYYDDGISGRSAKKRGDFNLMIAAAKEKDCPFDVIYVWKFSRFARNQEESLVYKNLLKKKGITVKSVSEPIPEGHFGSLIERIIEWMDEFYSINLSGEVVRGMTEKASRGEPTCAPPFGYIMRDGKYYPDEESGKANIVREVFALYSNGVKQREIALILAEKGIRTRYGKKPENRWVDYMLHNSCYIGKIRFCTDGTRSVSKRKLDNDNIMIVDGKHEPLVSIELWEKVQKMLDEQKKAYPKYAKRQQPIDHMLKGLVRCSSCGGTLAISGVSGKAKVRCLQCCNYSRGSCRTSHSVTLPKIEAAFMAGLKEALETKKFTISPHKPKSTGADRVDYDKLITVEERRLERAREAYLAEIDTLEQYAQKKKEIIERIDDLKAKQISDTSQQEFDVDAFAAKVFSTVEFIEKDDVTAAAKNEALHTIIEKVVYEKAKGNLAIYFHDLQS